MTKTQKCVCGKKMVPAYIAGDRTTGDTKVGMFSNSDPKHMPSYWHNFDENVMEDLENTLRCMENSGEKYDIILRKILENTYAH